MLTPRRCASRYDAVHLLRLRPQLLRAGCFLCLVVSIVIFSPASSGQETLPVAPADLSGNGLPSSGNAKPSSGPTSIEPLTRGDTESSTEIAPADQRVMSDIQEIRAMLGGGLKREFEEINQTLRQYPGAMASPASQSQANDRSGGAVAQDRGAANGDWFIRELGQMVRKRSQALPSPDQVESTIQQQRAGQENRSELGLNTTRLSAPLSDKPATALRQCARELELVAGALEQIEAYENADTVRQEAVKLWEKARNE